VWFLLSACSSTPSSVATPDAFSAVADQSRHEYERGQELYQQGRYREAWEAFHQAQLLNPAPDSQIDAMLVLAAAQLTPTVVPAPATATASAEPTRAVVSVATPAIELGSVYFGDVFLTVVPGRDWVPPAMREFSDQDQIGLYVPSLGQRMRMPFTVRIFDSATGRLVAESRSETVTRFFEHFIWYQQAPESPGQYRLELYAGDTLTNVLDYRVGTTPVAIPTPTVVTSPTAVAEPTATLVPVPPTAVVVAPTPAPAPAPAPAPVVVVQAPPPTPAPRSTTLTIDAGPSALIGTTWGVVYVGDRSGAIWIMDGAPSTLRRPLTVNGEVTGLAIDEDTARLFVTVQRPPMLAALDVNTGQQVAALALPAEPADVRVDSALGRAYVLLPSEQALMTVALGSMTIAAMADGLDAVTRLALDGDAHTVYLSHLGGELSIFDGTTGQPSLRMKLSGAGLSGVAGAGGRAYAINTPGRELFIVDVATGAVDRVPLAVEPSAVALSSQVVALLAPLAQSIVRLDLASGAELGRLRLGLATVTPDSLAPEDQALRARLWVSDDGATTVIDPRSGHFARLDPP